MMTARKGRSRGRTRQAHVLTASLSVVVLLCGSACQTNWKKQPGPQPPAQPAAETPPEEPIPREPEPDEIAELRKSLDRRDATIHQLEEENSRQALLLLERDALARQLEERLLSQQRSLDDTIQEVVRVKAKQRSLESRAETASEMAEAEIALKSLRDKTAGEDRPGLTKAGRLLEMAVREFENGNFGGALYLISQAKSQIKIGMMKPGDHDEVAGREGEMPFAVPLPLRVVKRSNIREGPGLQFEVLATLDEGTWITGYSARGSWLRVESSQGLGGWIHLSLVSST